MKIQAESILQRIPVSGILLDITALAFIYFVPTLSHMLSVPLYLIEPMRLMLVLALVHTNKRNSYILALSMPLFSFLISGHPVFAKMFLIGIELSLNVFLFYLLANKMKNMFPAIFISILLSKTVYYLLKFAMIRLAIIDSSLIATPLLIQLVMTLVFSSYLFIILRNREP